MSETKKLKLNHLYAKSLNIYGDLGNIKALEYHAKASGIALEIVNSELRDSIEEADIYFIGGGQDRDQIAVFEDLLMHKDFIKAEVERGKVFLLICGGYQLFGKFFVAADGSLIKGLEILDIETRALDEKVSSRCIGNIVVELLPDFVEKWKIDTSFSNLLVGFENHGGQTHFVSDTIKPFAKVLKGFGNNSHDRVEGGYYKNIIGSYMHGSLLPKNPHLAQALLNKALENRGLEKVIFKSDLSLEKSAHSGIVSKLLGKQ